MAISLVHAHATVMIMAWIFFGSTGVLFARYGRSLRLGNRRQMLGKAVWFQIHRFLLSITSLFTLLGFFFIIVYAGGTWVDPHFFGLSLFAHSILGSIIVCCTILQVWLALYRCNPHSRFRYLFDWSHRITGFLAFGLSIPAIFLIIVLQTNHRTALITIISFWTGWIVFIMIIFEKIESQQRAAVAPTGNNVRENGTNRNNTNQSL
jgi:hypothetical protein